MDFSKYRQNGEMSDVSVVVDGKELKLHKFPLYTRSGYFKERVQGQNTIKLDDFPGGVSIFETVADYCYNVRIDIKRENVCQLRCAAEFLEMTSTGNLAELTDRHLQEMITCAKIGRSSYSVIDLLLEACALGDIADKSKVVERCINGVVDSWLIQSSRFSRRSQMFGNRESEDLKKLCELPVNRFKQIFQCARDKNVRASLLASIIQFYTEAVADYNQPKEEQPQPDTQAEEEEEKSSKRSSEDTDNEEKGKEEPAEDKEEDDKDKETEETKDEVDDQQEDTKAESQKDSGKFSRNKPGETDMRVVLDQLLPELPDTAAFSDAVEPAWAVRMVVLAEQLESEHRSVLRGLIRRMIYSLSAKELAGVPPPLLCEILKETSADNKHVPEMVCHVIDSYLVELANKDELTVDTFKNMVQAVPAEYRANHDGLFQILELLLNSDKSKVTEEQREILLEAVDYNRLNEKTLQRAYEENLVPASYVTKAALSLCSKLRAELDASRATVRAQQAELDKYGLGLSTGLGHVGSTSYGHQDTSRPLVSEALCSSRRDPAGGALYASTLTTYASPEDALLDEDLENLPEFKYRTSSSYSLYDKYGTGSYLTPRSRSYHTTRWSYAK